jgi:hypothetical protein
MRSERSYERNIGRVPTARDDDSTDPRNIVARIEGVPLAFEESVDPGAEIHRVNDGHAVIAEMAIDVARGDVEAATEGEREMSVVTAAPMRSLNVSNAVRVERACDSRT